VALPAVVGARMCLEGDNGAGVISSECLDPAIFFKKMAAMGLPMSFEEKIIKQISFS
jgi:saccharopine dehydrogenase-like NADP-dependent oxidoreductase